MTMPEERTRSVRRTRELLCKLSTSEAVPENVRGTAESILAHYPQDADLDLAAQGAPSWWGDTQPAMWLAWAEQIRRWLFKPSPASPNATPAERTQAVITGRMFLKQLRDSSKVPAGVRSEAEKLLRHYPWDQDLTFAFQGAPECWGEPGIRQR